MDKNHRDRVAFMRVCSGVFTRGQKLFHTRTEKDIVYRDELELIQENLPGFEYIPTLSREIVPGIAEGYVHKHYLDLIDKLDHKPLVYYCGWDRMIREGRDHLAERGFEMMKDIRVEIFG